MKIAFNPSTVEALIAPPNNKDITFDLRGHNIFARGVKFQGTDTWRPVVDNLTSDSTTSSLSANQGRVLVGLINGKSDSDHNHDDRYLRLTGGTMASNALITFADSGSWGTDKGPQGARGGLYWTGQSDYVKLYAEETAGNNLDLVIQFGDDNSNGLSIRNASNVQTSYISAGGVITTGTFKGNLDWSYITNKPATATRWPYWDEIANKPNTFTPSDHNHDGRYVRYYAVTTLDCNNLAVGLTAAGVSATNAALTNNSAFLYISDVGTPFQIQIPDSSVPYIYKRYYGSGGWSGWFKLNAGYADSAGSTRHLLINGTTWNSDWHWSGQGGQPSWLWGSNDGINMYVWNPSNFNVNTAQYLRSLGNQNCQTGRTQNYGDVYSYNTYTGNTGSPTDYTSVIGFGRGTGGTVEIAGGWCNTGLYWRSLRDCCEDWYSWRTVLDSSNYTGYVDNYYWANVKISTSSSTTTSPTVSNLTATSSIKMSNILLEHTDEINNSANGGLYLNYRSSGKVILCQGGGNVGIGIISPAYKLHVNGNIYSSGQIIREGYSTIWAQGRNVALLRETTSSGYHTLWSLKTTNGSWDFGEYNTSGWYNVPVLSYITDSNYNSGNNVTTYQIKFPLASGTVALTSYGGDSSHPIFLGYLNLEHGNDGTVSSSFSCLGYTVPFTYTRGGNYCRINIPDTTHQTFYIRAAIASVNYSGGDSAWWLHCYASGLNEVRVKGFCQRNSNNDSWWGGNPLGSGNNGANRITVCIFGNVTLR